MVAGHIMAVRRDRMRRGWFFCNPDYQRSFGAVGDHFDGVSEGFGQGLQLAWALDFGEILNGDFGRSLSTLGFEGVALGL